MPPPPPPPPPAQFSALACLCLFLNAAILKYHELTNRPFLVRLTREDGLIENLTAVFALLASILLFVTGRMERKALPRWIYIMGGIVALFVAGEEISWGQRILGYPTPDWMIERNRQEEFNLHNLHVLKEPMRACFLYGVQFLCMMACIAFFTGRERILRIPVPSILLTLGLLVTRAYSQDSHHLNFSILSLPFLSLGSSVSICFVIIFTLLCRQYELVIFSAAAIFFSLALSVVNYFEVFLISHNFPNEISEYLITLGVFLYSLELLLNQRPFIRADHVVRRSKPDQGRESIGPFFRRLAHPVGRQFLHVLDTRPPGNSGRLLWRAIPALLIAMSIGLMSLAYVDFRAEQTYARSLAQEIASREPIIRSHFDVYLSQNRLIYHKEACSLAEATKKFFLLVIPTDLNEFPIFDISSPKKHFSLAYTHKDLFLPNVVCFATYSLPRWEIAHIGTGQESLWGAVVTHADRHVPDGGVPADRFERATNCSINDAYRRMYDAVVSREPRVRSDFDIYFHDRTLIFVKKPCLPSDVETAFFLHVVPVDNASLPSFRQQYRYDNLDFRFSDSGRVFDDKCMAIVSLPAYDIDRIVSGQYTSEKRLWQVEFPAHTGDKPVSPGA